MLTSTCAMVIIMVCRGPACESSRFDLSFPGKECLIQFLVNKIQEFRALFLTFVFSLYIIPF